MLFFIVMALPALWVVVDARTYRRTDSVTGQMLECARCPPGSCLSAHCSSSRETACAPCGPGQFTEFWNYIPDCLLCDSCSDHQRVLRPCNGSANTVCQCVEGFYWDQHFCRRYSACKPGHGVKAAGTPDKDTVCEACADGQYANVTQAHAVCVEHSVCQTDEHLLLAGSAWYNSVCTTCRQLTSNGWTTPFGPVLSALNARYKVRISRLENQVNRRLRKSLKRLNKRAALHTSEELIDLSMMLENSHTSLLANVIAQHIRRVQRHCLSPAPL